MAKPGRRPTAKSIKEYFESGSGRKLWKEGREAKETGGGGMPEYDDGKYRVKLVKAYSAQSNTSGRWQNVLTFKFLEGEYKGQMVSQYQGVDNSIGIAILLKTFDQLGHDISGPDEIESADKKLAKEQPELEIRLRTKGEFQNVFVLKKLSDDDAEETEDEDDDADVEEADDEDDDKETEADEDDEDEEEKEEAPAKKKKSAKEDDDEDEDDAKEDEEDEDETDDEDADEDDEDEEEEEKPKKKSKEADEDKVNLEVGMKLKVKHDDEEVVGKIVKVMEDDEKVKVKLKNGEKITVGLDEIVDVVE